LTKKRPVNPLLKVFFGDSDILNNDETKELHMSMTNQEGAGLIGLVQMGFPLS